MREIKFRCWDNEFKKMYYDGFALRANSKANDLNILFESSHFKTGQYAPLDMKIMQFTGLKDKNGVEIYEGDIICVLERKIGFISPEEELANPKEIDRKEVVFKNGMFQIGWSSIGICLNENFSVEIIGNIYEK